MKTTRNYSQQPIVAIGALYVAMGHDPDKVADVTIEAMGNGKNVAEELKKAFKNK